MRQVSSIECRNRRPATRIRPDRVELFLTIEKMRAICSRGLVPCQWLIFGYDGHSCPSKRCRTRMSNLHFKRRVFTCRSPFRHMPRLLGAACIARQRELPLLAFVPLFDDALISRQRQNALCQVSGSYFGRLLFCRFAIRGHRGSSGLPSVRH